MEAISCHWRIYATIQIYAGKDQVLIYCYYQSTVWDETSLALLQEHCVTGGTKAPLTVKALQGDSLHPNSLFSQPAAFCFS